MVVFPCIQHLLNSILTYDVSIVNWFTVPFYFENDFYLLKLSFSFLWRVLTHAHYRIKDRYQYITSLKEIILLNVNNESMLIEANLTYAKHLFETHTIQIFFFGWKTFRVQNIIYHIVINVHKQLYKVF